jgi:hypothetical protein
VLTPQLTLTPTLTLTTDPIPNPNPQPNPNLYQEELLDAAEHRQRPFLPLALRHGGGAWDAQDTTGHAAGRATTAEGARPSVTAGARR